MTGGTLLRCSFFFSSATSVSVRVSDIKAAASNFSDVEAEEGKRELRRCRAVRHTRPSRDNTPIQTLQKQSDVTAARRRCTHNMSVLPSGIHLCLRTGVAQESQAAVGSAGEHLGQQETTAWFS